VTTVLATELPGAGGGLATAAALAVALAAGDGEVERPALLVEVGGERERGPTMLASASARELESRLAVAGFSVTARGRLCWLRIAAAGDACERLAAALDAAGSSTEVVAHLPGPRWRAALESEAVVADSVLVRADLPAQRPLAALLAADLHAGGLRVRIAARAPGRVSARRALAGIDPGGALAQRARRLGRGLGPARRGPGRPPRRLAGERGQALPLVLGAALALAFATLVLTAFGGAVTGKSRAQRAVDLAALSAARSMRDDFARLFIAARRPDGSPNPAHLAKPQYTRRAVGAALEAANRNGIEPGRLRIEFPDLASFAPLRVRAELSAEHDLPGELPDLPVEVHAEAEAVAPAAATPAGGPATASGGGYSGPLVYRQGEGMRPDVAAAFDRMVAAASADGIALLVNSGFRSDAEQAALFAANPDPRWVAPSGTSLHRCATELDLGPASAYGWLAANAPRFGFLKRYSWEAWHFGFTAGPAPCSVAGDRLGAGRAPAAGAAETGASLPAFVPARFRESLARAAGRWNVSASLLAAQLMAESNFNPFAVSPAGAQGIAQFMPATAAGYGLDDPFDAAAAIDAQAHLMSDLLEQLGGRIELALAAYNAGPGPVTACDCIPSYPETQAYVARILGLMGGAGAIGAAPTLEVRLVD
jgi:hypothetical protein